LWRVRPHTVHIRYCSGIDLDGEFVHVFPYFHPKKGVWEEKKERKAEEQA